jgi:ribosomal protein L7Ae-like RNA K-turn-binding protein
MSRRPRRPRRRSRPRRMAATDRALSMLGMATRAGAVITGTDRVREAARGGSLRLAILAHDASANSRGKLLPLLEARGMAYVVRFDRKELGAAVGRAPLSAVGIVDAKLSDRLQALLRDSAGQG